MTVPEDFEEVLKSAEKFWERDLSLVRDAAPEVFALETGDPTPLPGTLKRAVVDATLLEPPLELAPESVAPPWMPIAPPMHQGPYDTVEGPFFVRKTFEGRAGRHYSVGDLAKKLTRTRAWLALLTMCFVSAMFVIALRWNG